MNKFMLKSSVLAALVFAAASASAASPQNANMGVSANVAANCTISTAPVLFGDYDPIQGGALAAAGKVTITCTKGAVTTIGMSLGANPAGSVRNMSNGTSALAYELFHQDDVAVVDGTGTCADLATVWGTVGSARLTPGAAPSKAARIYSVCGTVAAGQDVTAGSYSDTVVASVIF
ncbi:MAG: spore coat U domain-containing protein [Pseudomonadota bacterium]